MAFCNPDLAVFDVSNSNSGGWDRFKQLSDQGIGMPASRRERLQAMLIDDPGDVFLHYALATEYLKEGDVSAAEEKFTELHENFPDYVPAWFQHAQALAEQGRTDEARRTAEQGLATAKRVGDTHAAGEITGFLELL